jgi:hypothetical protein
MRQITFFPHRQRARHVGSGGMTMMLTGLIKRARRGLRRLQAAIAAGRLRRLRNELVCHGGFVATRDASHHPTWR